MLSKVPLSEYVYIYVLMIDRHLDSKKKHSMDVEGGYKM